METFPIYIYIYIYTRHCKFIYINQQRSTIVENDPRDTRLLFHS